MTQRFRPSRFHAALPAYLGGKRRLAQLIFALIQDHQPHSTWAETTFLDAFSGSGAIALHAKLQGFATVASDAAERAVIPARALVANSTTKFCREDVLSLLVQPRGPYARRAAAIVPPAFTATQATSVDHALTVAALKPEPLRSLLQLAMAALHRAEERFTGVQRGLEYPSEPLARLDIEPLRALAVDGDRRATRRLAELERRAQDPLRRREICVRRRAGGRRRAAPPAAEKGGDDAIS